MSDEPDLLFRRLAEGDKDLAGELAAAAHAGKTPGAEFFGLPGGAPPPDEAWGLFIRGTLCGGAWFRLTPGDAAEVTALVVAKGWQRTGLADWMLGELSRTAALAGAGTITARLTKDDPVSGEVLEDAGFAGPNPEDETYPAGEWRRLAGKK